jgi:putative inorganic carbon (HCO3(-)) transporter
MLFSGIKPIYKVLVGLTFFLGCGSLMWTSSRGGWISFTIASVFVGLCVFGNITGRAAIIKTFAYIMAVFIFISPIYPRLFVKFYGRLGGSDRGSAESRLPQYEVAYNIIKDNPLIGIGINNYTKIVEKYDVTEEGLESLTRYAVHNIFLHIAAEMGIFGLAVFLWLMFSILVEGVSYIILNKNFMAYTVVGMVAGIIAFLVHGFVDTASLGSKLFMFVWFFAGIIFAIKRIKPLTDPVPE